jgi:hypothetical protein
MKPTPTNSAVTAGLIVAGAVRNFVRFSLAVKATGR